VPAKKIRFIGVPLDLGAGRRGVDMGPSAFRVAEIHARVRALGYEVSDRGDIDVFIQETHDPGDPRLKYLREIRHTCEQLRDEVDRTLGEGAMPVVLGGDHSIAMGTIAGVSRHFRKRDERIGLIWFDAHGDMNTPETSPSGNIHGMPLAVVLGIGEKSLVSLAGEDGPMVEGARAAVVGLRDVDPAEKENIRESGIGAFTMRDIDERGMREVMADALKYATDDTDGISVSLDMDFVDPSDAPGVGTPVRGGVTYREAHLAMEMIADSDAMASMEIVEINPVIDEHNRTALLGVELILSGLGQKIL
jgi:arginase